MGDEEDDMRTPSSGRQRPGTELRLSFAPPTVDRVRWREPDRTVLEVA